MHWQKIKNIYIYQNYLVALRCISALLTEPFSLNVGAMDYENVSLSGGFLRSKNYLGVKIHFKQVTNGSQRAIVTLLPTLCRRPYKCPLHLLGPSVSWPWASQASSGSCSAGTSWLGHTLSSSPCALGAQTCSGQSWTHPVGNDRLLLKGIVWVLAE